MSTYYALHRPGVLQFTGLQRVRHNWETKQQHYALHRFLSGSVVKNLPAMLEMQETQVRSLGWEDPLEEVWQPTPVFLPGESPWTEEPGGLQSMVL